jgi:hypothetical protein
LVITNYFLSELVKLIPFYFFYQARNVLDEMEEGTFSPRKMSQNFDKLLTARDRYVLKG